MKRIFLALIIIASLHIFSASGGGSGNPADIVFFELANDSAGKVEPQYQLRPLFQISNGMIGEIPRYYEPGGAYRPDKQAYDDFLAEHMKRGREYLLLFGNRRTGTATIVSGEPSLNPSVMLDSPLTLDLQTRALATNSTLLGSGTCCRRAPTSGEEQDAVDLARILLKKHHVADEDIENTKHSLAAFDYNQDGYFELVGFFTDNEYGGGRLFYFFVFEKGSNGYKETLSNVVLDPVFEYWEKFIDAVDLDKDGLMELVTRYASIDDGGACIYKKKNARWEKIFPQYSVF